LRESMHSVLAGLMIAMIVGLLALRNLFEEHSSEAPASVMQELTGAQTDSRPAAKTAQTPPIAPQPTPQAQAPAPQLETSANPAPAPTGKQEPAASPSLTRGKKTKSRPSTPQVLAAQMAVDSTPSVAQLEYEGDAL
jgi:hypothetical protein